MTEAVQDDGELLPSTSQFFTSADFFFEDDFMMPNAPNRTAQGHRHETGTCPVAWQPASGAGPLRPHPPQAQRFSQPLGSCQVGPDSHLLPVRPRGGGSFRQGADQISRDPAELPPIPPSSSQPFNSRNQELAECAQDQGDPPYLYRADAIPNYNTPRGDKSMCSKAVDVGSVDVVDATSLQSQLERERARRLAAEENLQAQKVRHEEAEEQLQDQLNQLVHKLKQQETQVDMMQKQLDNRMQANKAQESIMAIHQREVDELKQQVDHWKDRCQEVEKELETGQRRLTLFHEDQKQCESDLVAARREQSFLTEQLMKSRAEANELREQLRVMVVEEEHRQQVWLHQMEGARQSTTNQVALLRDQLQEDEKARQQLASDLATLRQENQRLRGELLEGRTLWAGGLRGPQGPSESALVYSSHFQSGDLVRDGGLRGWYGTAPTRAGPMPYNPALLQVATSSPALSPLWPIHADQPVRGMACQEHQAGGFVPGSTPRAAEASAPGPHVRASNIPRGGIQLDKDILDGLPELGSLSCSAHPVGIRSSSPAPPHPSTPCMTSQPPTRPQVNAGAPDDRASPFATDYTTQDFLQKTKKLEDQLLALNQQKAELESEFSKMPLHGGRSLKERQRRTYVEGQLDTLNKEISTVRLQLKKIYGK